MFGFHFTETMQGTYTRDGGPERDISFTITARASSWLKHLRDHKALLDGTLRMDGFASSVPLSGELFINPLFGHIIKYAFQFTADDGKTYSFRGQKDVRVSDLVGTMTTLPATISDASDRPVAHARLKFDPRDLPSFLGSFRPA